MPLFFQIYAIFLLILSLIGLIHYIIARKGCDREDVVRLPLIFQPIGIVGTVVFGIILLWAIYDGENTPWVLIGFALLSLLGVALIVAPFRTIRYDREGFTLRTIPFFIPRRYEYSEITAIREDMNVLYLGRRRILLEDEASNYFDFLDQISRAYKKLHGTSIPLRKKRVNIDPFKGNVNTPGGFVFAYVLLYLVIVGFLLMGWFMARPPAEESLPVRQVIFTRCEVTEERIEFFIDGDPYPYRIVYPENSPTTDEAFTSLAKEKQTVSIRAQLMENADTPRYTLYSITGADGTEYLTYEDAAHEMRLVWYLILGMSAVFAALWIWYVVRSIQVGRNPKKYSRKTILRYFRAGMVQVNGKSVK